MLMRSLSLACMIWLFAETQQEMRLLASDWLATPALGGSGGMLSRKIFENLHAVMAILVLFEQFSRNFVQIFRP